MNKTIAILPGDGVGPEVTAQAVKVLKKVAKRRGHEFTFVEGLIGATAIDKTGSAYPDATHELCLDSDAVLCGAVGDPKYDNDSTAVVLPEHGLRDMRIKLGLHANVHPIMTFSSTIDKSPLKSDLTNEIDFIVVRELSGGMYVSEPSGRSEDGEKAFDTSIYTKQQILRVAKYAFELASHRKRRVTVVDKANVLATSRLWRETVREFARDYRDIQVDFMFMGRAAMQIIKNPSYFDVILTENMFGDILTDEASVITGSVGMLPSASVGDKVSVYEPIHGSFSKLVGKNVANPLGTILSAAMLLEYSFRMKREAEMIRTAVDDVLSSGFGTKDIDTENALTTSEMGDKILDCI